MLDNCPACATWIQCYQDAAKEADRLRARVAELEESMHRIVIGPYAGQYASAVEVAAAALRAGEVHGTRP